MKKPVKSRLDKKTESRFSWRKSPSLSRRAQEEFGPGKTDIILCPEGDAVYYYKSWHHDLERYRELSETKAVTFTLCPFHEMKKNRQWEGEVRLVGVPATELREILASAQHISDEARRRDPMHGILDIKTEKNMVSIYTSENQLSGRIAKRIGESHKHHLARRFHHGKESDVFLITLEWIA
ncbi:MAG: hypothetical protein HYT22_00995 [Candidatus Niyogibacteria bacterium]|nr:hypothetical protein [Candidatus Niyogibacteria bacterium]